MGATGLLTLGALLAMGALLAISALLARSSFPITTGVIRVFTRTTPAVLIVWCIAR